MISKTAMLELVKGFRAGEVERVLASNPALFDYRDERGRNWLHVCCGQKVARAKVPDSIKTAAVLLARGYDMNGAAFTEGTWRATPVWYTVGRGENLALTEYLLKRGADPNHSLWAASFRGDLAAIRLLVRHGADLEAVAEDTAPFLGAVKWSRFAAAEEFLKLGANPDFRDKHGMTALHYMLKKASDTKHIAMVVRYGARGDIRDKAGRTAIDILSRKRDPALRRIAEQLAAKA
jgi:hypothetical protein